MSIFAFCAFLPREFERNRTLSKKTIYRLRKSLGWCIIKLKIRLRIFLYTPVLCLWSSDDRNHNKELYQSKMIRRSAKRPFCWSIHVISFFLFQYCSFPNPEEKCFADSMSVRVRRSFSSPLISACRRASKFFTSFQYGRNGAESVPVPHR